MKERPIRVCMLVGTDMSHDARVWKEALSLASAGYVVTVLAANNNSLPARELRGGVEIIRVTPRSLWTRNKGRVSESPNGEAAKAPNGQQHYGIATTMRHKCWGLRTFISTILHARRLKPDVLHIHDADRLAVGLILAQILRVPIVYDAHEYVRGLHRETLGASTHLTYCLLERWVARRSAVVVTVNSEIASRLTEEYRIANVIVVHNFPTLSGGDHELANANTHERPTVLFQGRLTAERGIPEFIAAMALLDGVAGKIVGSGPMEDQLKTLATTLGLDGRLEFIPQVPWDKLHRLTRQATLGICLSQPTCENNMLALPNKLFEYLMAGVPVVASDFPVISKYVEGEGVGLTVTPDSPAEIARAIHTALRDEGRLQQMRQNAIKVSRDKYNWNVEEKVLLDAYKRIRIYRR